MTKSLPSGCQGEMSGDFTGRGKKTNPVKGDVAATCCSFLEAELLVSRTEGSSAARPPPSLISLTSFLPPAGRWAEVLPGQGMRGQSPLPALPNHPTVTAGSPLNSSLFHQPPPTPCPQIPSPAPCPLSGSGSGGGLAAEPRAGCAAAESPYFGSYSSRGSVGVVFLPPPSHPPTSGCSRELRWARC